MGRPSRVAPLVLALAGALVLAAAPLARAEDRQLRGQVRDAATGQPVARAEVSILGYPGERLTDADGRFTWQPAPAPPFELLIVLPGGRYTRPVLVERVDGDVLEIRVESLVSEALTVTAGAAPGIHSTPGAGTTLVTAMDLQARGPATLAQALETVAGVSTVSEGHAAAPAVRGFAAGRTLILLDGARVTSERRVGPSATFLDPFALESVEVARGPGSVAYGSDAFGGVISARTRRVAPGAPLALRLAATAGAGIPEWRGGVELSKGFARGGVLVQGHGRAFDDYRSPAGRVFNSGARDRGLLARFEHAAGPGTLSVTWQSDAGREVGRPRDDSRVVRVLHPRETSHRLTGGYEVQHLLGFERLTATAFTGRYAVMTDQDRTATAAVPRVVERADVAARDFQVRVIASRPLRAAHVSLGTDVHGRHGLRAYEDRLAYNAAGARASTMRTTAVDGARRTDVGLFADVQAPLAHRLLLGGGLRGDRVTTANRGGYFGRQATARGAGSGFVSLTAGAFRGITLTGQVSRGFRDPLLSDRYFRGPTGRGYITGNPGLSPETSLQFDAAVRYTAPRARAAAYAFHYTVDGLVERYEAAPDQFFFRNRGHVVMRGVELEVQAVAGAYTWQATGQLTRGRGDAGPPPDGVPPASLSLQVRRSLGVRGFVQARGAAHARGGRPGPTERSTPGYGVVDLSGGWRLAPGLEVRALGRNVLDQSYLVSADRRTVPAPGASVAVTLVATLGPRTAADSHGSDGFARNE